MSKKGIVDMCQYCGIGNLKLSYYFIILLIQFGSHAGAKTAGNVVLSAKAGDECDMRKDVLLVQDSVSEHAYLQCKPAGRGVVGFWQWMPCSKGEKFYFSEQRCLTASPTNSNGRIVISSNLPNARDNENLTASFSHDLDTKVTTPANEHGGHGVPPDTQFTLALTTVLPSTAFEILPRGVFVNESCGKGHECIGGSVCDATVMLCICPHGTIVNGAICVPTTTASTIQMTTERSQNAKMIAPGGSCRISVDQCGGGSFCNPGTSVCSCPEGHVDQAGACTIVKIQTVLPGQQCGTSAYCTGGAICSKGLCVCEAPLIQVGSQCGLPSTVPVPVKKHSGPGQQCDQGQICINGSLCSTVTVLCTCPIGTRDNGEKCVEVAEMPANLAGVGQECNINNDCVVGAFCSASNNPPTCQCLSTHIEVGKSCYRIVYPGQRGCHLNDQCSAGYEGASCRNSVCVCPPGMSARGQTCRPVEPVLPTILVRLGQSCLSNTTTLLRCSAGSVCVRGQCVCPRGRIQSGNNCVQKDARNLNLIDNKTLNARTNDFNHYSTDNHHATGVIYSSPGSSCAAGQHCTGGSVCRNGWCICPDNEMIVYNGTCAFGGSGAALIPIDRSAHRSFPPYDEPMHPVTTTVSTTQKVTVDVYDPPPHTLLPSSPKQVNQPYPMMGPNDFSGYYIRQPMAPQFNMPIPMQSPLAHTFMMPGAPGLYIPPNAGQGYPPVFIPEPTNSPLFPIDQIRQPGIDPNSIVLQPYPLLPGLLPAGLRQQNGQIINAKPTTKLAMPSHHNEKLPHMPVAAPLMATKESMITATPGSSCDDHVQCIGGSICHMGQCICNEGYEVNGDLCVPQATPTAVGPLQSCANGEMCDGGSLCDGRICQCPAGTEPRQGLCQAIPPKLSSPNGPCSNGERCSGGSHCNQGTGLCECPAATLPMAGRCLPIGRLVTTAPFTTKQNEEDETIEDISQIQQLQQQSQMQQQQQQQQNFQNHLPIYDVKQPVPKVILPHQKSFSPAGTVAGVSRAPSGTNSGAAPPVKLVHISGLSGPDGKCDNGQVCAGGSVCQNGICKCPLHTKANINGICEIVYALAASVGETCTEETVCVGQSQCINGRCRCPQGTMQTGPTCIPLQGVDQSYRFYRGLNQDDDPTRNIFRRDDNEFQPLNDVLETAPTIQCPLGESPILDKELNNSDYLKCNASRPFCPPGSYCYAFDKALELGPYHCCAASLKSKSVIVPRRIHQKRALLPPGTVCKSTDLCTQHAICQKGLCVCRDGYREYNGTCQPVSARVFSKPGDACVANESCLGNAFCLEGHCACFSGFIVRNDTCIQGEETLLVGPGERERSAPGDPCLSIQDCTGGSYCRLGYCVCPLGTNGFANIGQSCANGERCTGRAICANGFCQCPNDMVNVNGVCQSPWHMLNPNWLNQSIVGRSNPYDATNSAYQQQSQNLPVSPYNIPLPNANNYPLPIPPPSPFTYPPPVDPSPVYLPSPYHPSSIPNIQNSANLASYFSTISSPYSANQDQETMKITRTDMQASNPWLLAGYSPDTRIALNAILPSLPPNNYSIPLSSLIYQGGNRYSLPLASVLASQVPPNSPDMPYILEHLKNYQNGQPIQVALNRDTLLPPQQQIQQTIPYPMQSIGQQQIPQLVGYPTVTPVTPVWHNVGPAPAMGPQGPTFYMQGLGDQDPMYHHIKNKYSPLPLAAPGQQCQMGQSCTGGAICSMNVCSCPAGLKIGPGNECVPDGVYVPPGSYCTNGQICIGGSYCITGICLCPPGQDIVGQICRPLGASGPFTKKRQSKRKVELKERKKLNTFGTNTTNSTKFAKPNEPCQKGVRCLGGTVCSHDGHCRCLKPLRLDGDMCRQPEHRPNQRKNQFSPTSRRPLQCPLPENGTLCQLPNCFCSKSGKTAPGNLELEQIPQFVILTFDDAVNQKNIAPYKTLLEGRYHNKNGCPIRGTFFVSHEGTDYIDVQKLYIDGHEMASNSITHEDLGNKPLDRWIKEMDGQRRIMTNLGNVNHEDITGLRAPQLSLARHATFEMMQNVSFLYDNSMSANAGVDQAPYWPQTLDYSIPWECQNSQCPQRSYPGLWTIPLNQFFNGPSLSSSDPKRDGAYIRGAMIRACLGAEETEESFYQLLHHNFMRAYKTNKAPYILTLDGDIPYVLPENGTIKALERFLGEIIENKDVWFVTLGQLLDWMRSPIPVDQLDKFTAFTCDDKRHTGSALCQQYNHCQYRTKRLSKQRHAFKTCSTCPRNYPWIDNIDAR